MALLRECLWAVRQAHGEPMPPLPRRSSADPQDLGAPPASARAPGILAQFLASADRARGQQRFPSNPQGD